MSLRKQIGLAIPLLAALGTSLCLSSCDVHTDKVQASHVKARTEMKILLTAMDAYKTKNGQLPGSLEELAQNDPWLSNIDVRTFTYSSNAFTIADGTSWLIWIADPKTDEQVIVGRLPIEITTATKTKDTKK
jgi:hypothetical protein